MCLITKMVEKNYYRPVDLVESGLSWWFAGRQLFVDDNTGET